MQAQQAALWPNNVRQQKAGPGSDRNGQIKRNFVCRNQTLIVDSVMYLVCKSNVI